MQKLKIIPVIIVMLIVSAFTHIDAIPDEEHRIGDIAKDFKLKNVDENLVALLDFDTAKGFIVIFTCNTCPFSVLYEDRINALDKKFATKGYPVVAIMPNNPKVKPGDGFDAMKIRAKKKGFTFPYLIDEDQKIYRQYGATKTPQVYVLQKTAHGNMVKYIGAIDDNYQNSSSVKVRYVEQAVESLILGKVIKQKKTKIIGCSIKM